MQEKTFMAETQIAKRTYTAYNKTSPQKAYENLLALLKANKVRITIKTFFIVREVEIDPKSEMVTYYPFSTYGISGKKNEIEALLSMAA